MKRIYIDQSNLLCVSNRSKSAMYCLLAIVIFMVSVISIPGTPMGTQKIPTFLNGLATSMIPQGWAFFTKTSQDPVITPYNLSGESVSLLPTSRYTNGFGINRKGRAQGVELGLLQQDITDADWEDCTEVSDKDCIRKLNEAPLRSIENPSQSPSLCGDVFFLKSIPHAYAYRSLTEGDRRLIGGAGAHVRCG